MRQIIALPGYAGTETPRWILRGGRDMNSGVMDQLLASIAARKKRLDAMRPVSREALLALQKAWDVDLTYTSNAIEGNSLSLRETAEVIEHGITVGGKPLRDHLEAVDHYNALLWMRALAAATTPID
jgi:Fic family protein